MAKTTEELNALRNDILEFIKKTEELSDEELNDVTGGVVIAGDERERRLRIATAVLGKVEAFASVKDLYDGNSPIGDGTEPKF